MDIYKRSYLVGLCVYVAFIVFAVVFYLERIVFLDAAYSVFYMAKDGNFAIQIYRFGDGLARLLPLLCVWLKLPLWIVAMAYSIGYVLVFVSCYLICGFGLKQYRLALIILLVNILFVSETFYWPTAQLPQATALAMVMLSLLWGRQFRTLKPLSLLIPLLLLITIVFFHPLMLVVMAYLVGFFWIRKDSEIDRKTLLAISLSFVGILIIKFIFFSTAYEAHAYSGLKNFVELFPNYFDTYANRNFLSNCVSKYYWIPIVFAIVLVRYVVGKEYKKAALFFLTVVGFIFFINTCYPSAYTTQFYIEVQYLPLGVFLAVPLVFDVLPAMNKIASPVLIGLIVFTGIGRVYSCHTKYTERIAWERAFLKKYGDKKMIVDSHKANASVLLQLWGTPYEFWLLSSIDNGKFASILIDDNPHDREWAKDVHESLILQWSMYHYKDLNKTYFKVSDTTTYYIVDPDLK